MTSKTTIPAYMPASNQITVGAGTLTRVAAAQPQISPLRGDGTDRILHPMTGVVYDAASPADLSTPLLALNGTQDTGAVSLAFVKGLLVVQTSPSSITLTY